MFSFMHNMMSPLDVESWH